MNRKLSALVMLASLAGFCGAQTAGQAKPNFSGTWKLNLQKSTLGQFSPTSETDTITQTADEFKIEVASESQRGKARYHNYGKAGWNGHAERSGGGLANADSEHQGNVERVVAGDYASDQLPGQ